MGIPLILAATLTFGFQGLQMFQGDGGGNKHLVVVNALDHYHDCPQVSIWRAAKGGPYAEVQRIDLWPGDVIRLSAPRGRVTTNRAYRKHVPRLGRFVREGRVPDKVDNGVDGVLATMDLLAGELRAWGTFADKVEIGQSNGWLSEHCLAQFVVMQSEVADPGTIYVSGGTAPANPRCAAYGYPQRLNDPYPLKDGDLIFVSNVSDEKDHLHFPVYEKLLQANGRVGAVKVLYGDACDTSVGKNTLTLGRLIEDALAERGRPTPNGDCGQVRNGG